MLKAKVQERLKGLGIKSTIVAKNIGYELRCTDPIPFDMEYPRDLGYCAAKYLLEDGTDAMVTIQQGKFRPIGLTDMLDPDTGRTRVRMVDVGTEHHKIARFVPRGAPTTVRVLGGRRARPGAAASSLRGVARPQGCGPSAST